MTDAMTHEAYEEYLAAYVLGVLEGDDLRQLEAHLAAGCARCREVLPKMMETAATLSLTLPPKPPPAEVKALLLAQIEADRAPVAPRWAWLAAAMVLVSVGLWMWNARVEQPVAQIVFAKGAVTVDAQAVSPQQFVRAGQNIVTAEQSEAVVRFVGDAASVYLMDRTRVGMPETRDRQTRRLRLSEGRVLNIVRAGEAFSIETPLGRVDALGTVFFVKMDSAQKLYVCICGGRIGVSSGGVRRTMEADHHAAMEIVEVDGRREFVPAAMRDHTDSDIAALQSRLK